MKLFWKKFIKFWLLFMNFLILGLGVCVSLAGAMVKYDTELLDGHVTPLVRIIPAGGGTGQDVYTLYDGVATAMIGFGFVMGIVGIIGCFVGMCPSKQTYLAYSVLMTVIFLIQITAVFILVTMQVDSGLKETLLSNFVNKYKGDEATDQYSKAWNHIFVEFGCCAVNNYKDFLFCYWDRQKTVGNDTFLVEIPVTCCRVPGNYPDFGSPYDKNCTLNPTVENSYMYKGCNDEVYDYLWIYRLFMILTLLVAIVVEGASTATLLLLEYARKQDERPPREDKIAITRD